MLVVNDNWSSNKDNLLRYLSPFATDTLSSIRHGEIRFLTSKKSDIIQVNIDRFSESVTRYLIILCGNDTNKELVQREIETNPLFEGELLEYMSEYHKKERKTDLLFDVSQKKFLNKQYDFLSGLPDSPSDHIFYVEGFSKLFAFSSSGVFVEDDELDTWVKFFLNTSRHVLFPIDGVTGTGKLLCRQLSLKSVPEIKVPFSVPKFLKTFTSDNGDLNYTLNSEIFNLNTARLNALSTKK